MPIGAQGMATRTSEIISAAAALLEFGTRDEREKAAAIISIAQELQMIAAKRAVEAGQDEA